MNRSIPVCFLFCFLITQLDLLAQCSDAGACAIGHRDQGPRQQIGVTYLLGKSGKTDGLTFHAVRVEADFAVSERSRLSVEIPYSSQSGSLGSTKGIGDPIAIWNYTLDDGTPSTLMLHGGVKLSVADANAGNLPQAYQSTLGTNDFLIGVTYAYEMWNGSVVYQISRGRSDNNSTRLKRGDDILVRAGYRFAAEKTTVVGELLAVKRLEESSVRNLASTRPDDFLTVPKSDQFQVNLQGSLIYQAFERYNLHLLVALPLLKRDVNVDGLQRSFSLSIGVFHLY